MHLRIFEIHRFRYVKPLEMRCRNQRKGTVRFSIMACACARVSTKSQSTKWRTGLAGDNPLNELRH